MKGIKKCVNCDKRFLIIHKSITDNVEFNHSKGKKGVKVKHYLREVVKHNNQN